MPYVITTKVAHRGHDAREPDLSVTRRAVATLDETRGACAAYIAEHKREPHRPWRACLKLARDLPESGGTITLPDGTVIEVAPHNIVWFEAELEARGIRTAGMSDAEVIDTYIAAQGAPAA